MAIDEQYVRKLFKGISNQAVVPTFLSMLTIRSIGLSKGLIPWPATIAPKLTLLRALSTN